jgi:hypothetical protein
LMCKATQPNLRQKEAALQLGDGAFCNFRRSNSAANHGLPCWPGTPSEKSCASGFGHLQLRFRAQRQPPATPPLPRPPAASSTCSAATAGDITSASATCSLFRRHRLCLGPMLDRLGRAALLNLHGCGSSWPKIDQLRHDGPHRRRPEP